ERHHRVQERRTVEKQTREDERREDEDVLRPLRRAQRAQESERHGPPIVRGRRARRPRRRYACQPMPDDRAPGGAAREPGGRIARALYALPVLLLLAWALPLVSGARTLYLRDVLNTHLPMKAAHAEALREGRFLPLVDPYRSGGQPLLGNPNAVP